MKRPLCLALACLLSAAPASAADAPGLTMRDLAGEYSCGDEYLPPGERLKLARSGEFEHQEFACLPVVREEKSAKERATLRDGVLTLKPSASTPGSNDTYHPVRWGHRTYLVRTDLMDLFCDTVNSGDEPRRQERGSVFLLKHGDWKRPVIGLPEVPAFYRKHLLAKPLIGKVVLASKNKFYGRVNLGSNDGVWKGMTLYPYIRHGTKSGQLRAEVTKVKEHSCWISEDYGHFRLQAGWPVYSRFNP